MLLTSEAPASPSHAACTPIPAEKIAFQLATLRPIFMPPGSWIPSNATGHPPRAGTARPPQLIRAADEAALATTLAAMRSIGYQSMERFGGTLNLAPERYQELVSKSGIRVVSSHDPLDAEQAQETFGRARSLGQTYVGSWGFGDIGLDTLDNVLATAARLNEFGKAAAAAGLRLVIHNHEAEFLARYPYDVDVDVDGSGTTRTVSAWEIVATNTDAELVHFEIDLHWARLALGSEAALLQFLRTYRDRIELLHVKDTAADGSIAELGQGIGDWPSIFAAAGPQVRFYIWEHDQAREPLRSARIAYRYLRCED
jgi:sugar phosphate isomerase/epimerase